MDALSKDKNFFLDGKITFIIPLELSESKKLVNDYINKKEWESTEPVLETVFFEDDFTSSYKKTKTYLRTSRKITDNNKEYVYYIHFHIHSHDTGLLILSINFKKEPVKRVIKMTRFKVPSELKLKNEGPINHIIHVIEKIIGNNNPFKEIYRKKPMYIFKMICINTIYNSKNTLDFRNGKELLESHPSLVYGIFHADTNWQNLTINNEDLKNSFCESTSDNLISFPNYGWYFGSLLLISREVLLFFKPNMEDVLGSYFDKTLVPVVESALVREMILIRFERDLTGIMNAKRRWVDRFIPFVNFRRLRKLQMKTLQYFSEIKNLAEERNFRWFTEINSFRAICNVRYISEIEEYVKQLLEKIETLITHESELTITKALFILTFFTIIPIIIQIINLFIG